MGLFDLFKKGNKLPKTKDLVWKNQAAKFNGCLKLIAQYPDAVWISWFAETLSSFNQFIGTKNGIKLEIRMARSVMPFMVETKRVFFLEHYPLRIEEENLIQTWNTLEINVLNALDEPLFEQFGGDRIINLMEKLGMREDEFLEHAMISNSIRNAQDKLQQKVTVENITNSSKEWFKMNIG